VGVLEDLLVRVNKNRELQGLRLSLAHERMAMPVSAPTAAPIDISPPSTKDFGERPKPVAAPVIEAVEESPVIEAVEEEAPEILLDEESHDVFIEEEEEASTPGADVVVAATPELEAITQAKPTHPRPEVTARVQAVAAATREPDTQQRPEQTLILDEPTPTAEPKTRARPDLTPTPTPESAPQTTAPVTQVSIEPPVSADPDAVTGQRQAKEAAVEMARRPPPLPGTKTVVSEPAPALEPEAELQTPAPPDAAPALAARKAIKPAIIQPQIVATAKVAEMIGEIDAMQSGSFGVVVDASLSLSF
jgi:hypothetical protein